MKLFWFFQPCSQIMGSGVKMSTQAETLPLCSIREYFNSVEFLQKWVQKLKLYHYVRMYEYVGYTAVCDSF